MNDFISKYRDQISGVITGVDRLVFRPKSRFESRGRNEGISMGERNRMEGLRPACR